MYEIIYLEKETGKERTRSAGTYKELEYLLEEIIGSNFLELYSVRPQAKKDVSNE